jgi:AraC family transcriptional regulator
MPAMAEDNYVRNVSPPAAEHRRFSWQSGAFDTASRPFTSFVEGRLFSSSHLVMATLHGGAARHQFKTDCGQRYDGPDRAGTVSFLPAGCERRLRLHDVAWEWASIALPPEIFPAQESRTGLRSFTDQDSFLFGMLFEMKRLHQADGTLDVAYCDTMSIAAVHYLLRRYGDKAEHREPDRLSPWRIRRIGDFVDEHLGKEIRIPALASLVGLSEGHFHRAFRATTGETPLQFINRKRIERAVAILAREDVTIVELALRLGFVSPSHFARVFRSVTGVNPSQYRRLL